MGNLVKVYKVKDTKSGLYRTAGGGWSKTGKTWNGLGHLKSSISSEGWYSGRLKGRDLPDPHIVIIEIIVEEREGNTRTMADLIEEQRRLQGIEQKYGDAFRDLVTRIEKDGQQDDWQWCLLIPYTILKSAAWEEAMVAELKKQKLKQNSDYRKASSKGMAIAFKDKRAAALVRLGLPTDVTVISLDIKNYVEDES